jgi:hypothetical protein
MQYQSCPLDPFFGSIVKTPKHPLQLVLQVLVACAPTFKRSQNKGLKKKLSCHNVILVLVPIHQPIHNFVPNCMFNILLTYTTIHFHFLHKLGLCLGQTTNLHSILANMSTTIYNDKTKNKGTLHKNVAHE